MFENSPYLSLSFWLRFIPNRFTYFILLHFKLSHWVNVKYHTQLFPLFILCKSECRVWQIRVNKLFLLCVKSPISVTDYLSSFGAFEHFLKIKLQWERVFERRLTLCLFWLDFQSEKGFELTKDREIEMRGLVWSRPYFCFVHCTVNY